MYSCRLALIEFSVVAFRRRFLPVERNGLPNLSDHGAPLAKHTVGFDGIPAR